MTDTLIDIGTAVTEQQITAYLRENPDFFVKQPSLLADLRLPHESGEAISLVERQVSILRERNMDMRHRLSKLLDNARENDQLFDKTKRLVLSLLEGKNLTDTTDKLLHSFNNDFKIHHTTLLLYGSAEALPNTAARIVSVQEVREHIGTLLKGNKAMCGAFSETETQYLFGKDAEKVGSARLCVGPSVKPKPSTCLAKMLRRSAQRLWFHSVSAITLACSPSPTATRTITAQAWVRCF